MIIKIIKCVPEVLPSKIVLISLWIVLSLYVGQGVFLLSVTKSLRTDVLQVRQTKIINVPTQPAALFKDYLRNFNKNYDVKENVTRRFELFKHSLKEISRLNKLTGATHGLTKFSDMSKEEVFPRNPSLVTVSGCSDFDQPCLGKALYNILKFDVCNDFRHHKKTPLEKFDWRDSGKVGPVFDQLKCNACWAFGIVGIMESMAAMRNIEHGVRRSIQELIDCSNPKFSDGCGGGNVANVLFWLCNARWGVVTEDEYPLVLINDECRYRVKPGGLRVKHYCRYCDINSYDLQRIIAFYGPVMAVVNADPWQYYTGGVIQRACDPPGKNDFKHVVQIVGYNFEAEVPHYIIRNSWGDDFGVGGYVKLARDGNVCGLKDEIYFLDVYYR